MKNKILLMLIFILSIAVNACKKESTAAQASIVGKWYLNKKASLLYNNGVQINAVTKTNYTTDDFAQYYKDGTGYSSNTTAISPNISEFNYTLKGTTLVQFNSVGNTGQTETITSLTATKLSIHAEYPITDPNNIDVTDTEKDDSYYTRSN